MATPSTFFRTKVRNLNHLSLQSFSRIPKVYATPDGLCDVDCHNLMAPSVFRPPMAWGDSRNVHRAVIRLLIENMDKRKPIGRTVDDLRELFAVRPSARFCFDVGHARQVDPSTTEAALLVRGFQDRLCEVHMSEVNTASRHDPISQNAVNAFNTVMSSIPEDIPIIIESLIDEGQSDVETEIRRANEVFAVVAV